MGVANYVRTVRQYAQRRAIVQTGLGTQIVSVPFLGLKAFGGAGLIDALAGLWHCGGNDRLLLRPLLSHRCHAYTAMTKLQFGLMCSEVVVARRPRILTGV